mmetsp:Transcript_6502/g.23142  ORF Transcript_6502/g.23142 Transcript_6502/m.23142 type:complete len:702 (-) Transcript_6502:3433-5538(-)
MHRLVHQPAPVVEREHARRVRQHVRHRVPCALHHHLRGQDVSGRVIVAGARHAVVRVRQRHLRRLRRQLGVVGVREHVRVHHGRVDQRPAHALHEVVAHLRRGIVRAAGRRDELLGVVHVPRRFLRAVALQPLPIVCGLRLHRHAVAVRLPPLGVPQCRRVVEVVRRRVVLAGSLARRRRRVRRDVDVADQRKDGVVLHRAAPGARPLHLDPLAALRHDVKREVRKIRVVDLHHARSHRAHQRQHRAQALAAAASRQVRVRHQRHVRQRHVRARGEHLRRRDARELGQQGAGARSEHDELGGLDDVGEDRIAVAVEAAKQQREALKRRHIDGQRRWRGRHRRAQLVRRRAAAAAAAASVGAGGEHRPRGADARHRPTGPLGHHRTQRRIVALRRVADELHQLDDAVVDVVVLLVDVLREQRGAHVELRPIDAAASSAAAAATRAAAARGDDAQLLMLLWKVASDRGARQVEGAVVGVVEAASQRRQRRRVADRITDRAGREARYGVDGSGGGTRVAVVAVAGPAHDERQAEGHGADGLVAVQRALERRLVLVKFRVDVGGAQRHVNGHNRPQVYGHVAWLRVAGGERKVRRRRHPVVAHSLQTQPTQRRDAARELACRGANASVEAPSDARPRRQRATAHLQRRRLVDHGGRRRTVAGEHVPQRLNQSTHRCCAGDIVSGVRMRRSGGQLAHQPAHGSGAR